MKRLSAIISLVLICILALTSCDLLNKLTGGSDNGDQTTEEITTDGITTPKETQTTKEEQTTKDDITTESGETTPEETTTPEITECAHSFSEWITVKEPTCKDKGEKKRTCSLCDEYEIWSTQKTDVHTFDSDSDAECNVCGYEREVSCKHTSTTVLGAVEPTCTQSGLTEGKKCSSCGLILVKQSTVNAKGHTDGNWIIDTNPTCTEKGSKHINCSVCGVKTKTESIAAKGHTEVTDKAVAATCTADGKTEGKHCSACQTVTVAQTTVKAKGHTEGKWVVDVNPTCTAKGSKHVSCSVCGIKIKTESIDANGHKKVYDTAKEPTCTESGISAGSYCSVCKTKFSSAEVIPPLGHDPLSEKGIAATCTNIGMTDLISCKRCRVVISFQSVIEEKEHNIVSGKCTVCGYTDINFSDPKIYGSDYGYNYLGTLNNGKNLQELYKRIDSAALSFHNDTVLNLTEVQYGSYVLPKIYYNDLKITVSELRLVMATIEADRPIYYWFTGGFVYSDGRYCQPNVATEYIKGADRAKANKLVYDGAKEYYRALDGEKSAYLTAMGYHDLIISAVDYAYKSDGKTPENSVWAHSIIGVFTKQGVVCEGYTRAFQMLLNASGIENLFVHGYANERHAWNLVKLDDGKWYWFDLTWDDQEIALRGIRYNYFAVNDTQIVNWRDGHLGWQNPDFGSKNFLGEHVPFDDTYEDEFAYALPSRSDKLFSSNSVLEFRETFKLDGNTYAVIGYDKVQLVSTTNSATVLIPPAVAYGGRVYEVVYMGAMDNNGYFLQGSVFTNSLPTQVVLPSSMEAIGMGAFMEAKTLKTVVIQEGTKEIEALAFWGCRNLKTAYIPSTVTRFEIQAFAFCYELTDIHFGGTKAQWNAIEKPDNWNQGSQYIRIHCTDGDI